MQFGRRTGLRVAIELAPLVDVVFLLVLFFAASTTFLETSGLELELPEATASAQRPPQQITVVVQRDGQAFYEGEPLSDEVLEERLSQVLAQRDEKTVVLQADAGTRHGRVVQVMDRIRRAGALGLTVATRPPTDQPDRRLP